MATNITPTVYPKDLTMSLDSNHIRNEIRDFADDSERIFVPNGGPFFSQSMRIQTRDGRPLRPITEYQILYLNEEATLESDRNVCAVIRILNKSITSVVLDYRVIGGEYSNTVYGIKQDLLRGGRNDHVLDWNINVYNKPSEYPVGPHFHRGEDFTDWDAVWVQLEGIRKAIIHGDAASWQSVYDYIDAKMSRDISGIAGNYTTAIQQALDSTLVNYTLKTELNAYKATVYTKAETNNLINAAKTEAINKATEAKTAADAAKRVADTALANAATADAKAVAADNKAVANTAEINKLKTKDTAIDAEIAKLKQADTAMQTLVGNATGKVSRGAGNLLEMRDDGIYYGIQAPADKSNIYVDCVAGNDNTGNGTKANPYKTLNKGLIESPRNQSNTIWLKVIPTAQANTHHYELTIRSFNVTSGATRTITVYGHDLLDGPGFEAMKSLADKNVENNYANANIPNVPIYLRQRYYTEFGQNKSKTLGNGFLTDGSTLEFRKVDLIVDFLEPEKVAEGYWSKNWQASTIFFGVGKVSFKCCGIYRLIPASIKNENYVNNPAAAIYKKDYNTEFFTTSYPGQKIEFQFAYTMLGYAYAASEALTGAYKRGGKVTMDPRFDPANFKGFNWHGAPLNGTGCRPFGALNGGEIGITNSHDLPGGIGNAVRAGNWTEHKSNTGLWFTNHQMINGVLYKLGIPTNVATNLTLFTNNKADKNFGELETIPVGGLFITTKEYTNGTQVKADLGYGRWERYAKGMTLVGVDPAVRSSRANHVLSFWQKIGNTFGSYVNVLNTGNLPAHRHSKNNIWNKFVAKATDWNPTAATTPTGWDALGSATEPHIGARSTADWTESTEALIGSGYPINNVQPSITVGIWLRLPDATGDDPRIPVVYDNNIPDFTKSEVQLVNDSDLRNIKLSLNRHDLHMFSNRNINVGGFAYVGKPSVNNTTDTNRIFMYLNSQMVYAQRMQNRVVQPPSDFARQGTGVLTGAITGHEFNEFGKIIDYTIKPAASKDLNSLSANYRNALNAAKAARAQIVTLDGDMRGYVMGTQTISQVQTGAVPYNGDTSRQIHTFRSTVVNAWVANIASTYGFTGYPTAAKEFTSMLNHNASGEASGSVVLHEMSAEVPYSDNPWALHIVSRVQKGSISLTSGVIPNKVAFKEDYFYRRAIANNAGLNAPNHDVITWYLVIPTGFAT